MLPHKCVNHAGLEGTVTQVTQNHQLFALRAREYIVLIIYSHTQIYFKSQCVYKNLCYCATFADKARRYGIF